MTTQQTSNKETAIQIICSELKKIVPSDVNLNKETDITTDITIDSVAIMDLVFTLEEEFDVAIPLNSLTDVQKIGELADLVISLQK